MDLDALRELAWQSMGSRISHPGREPGYIYHHGQRVGSIALQLRQLIFPRDESLDRVILVGSWFHDVGKGIEPHWEYGALIVREMLKEHCPAGELEQIMEIVAGHTLRKQREYPPYVQLVQDADVLDHYGSMEIWLNFWFCARSGLGMERSWEFYAGEYLKQIERVRSLLNFPESVEFFDEKDRFVRQFVERFQREGRGELLLDQKKAKG